MSIFNFYNKKNQYEEDNVFLEMYYSSGIREREGEEGPDPGAGGDEDAGSTPQRCQAHRLLHRKRSYKFVRFYVRKFAFFH